jgi:diketogulonate reductase-like aldo/keto reductase
VVVRQPDVIAIPKASNRDHVVENHGALNIRLTNQDLTWLDLALPPPDGPRRLEIL